MALTCSSRLELQGYPHFSFCYTLCLPQSFSSRRHSSCVCRLKFLPIAVSCKYVTWHHLYITQHNPPVNSDQDENRGAEFVAQHQLYLLCICICTPAVLCAPVNVKSMFVIFFPLRLELPDSISELHDWLCVALYECLRYSISVSCLSTSSRK